MARPFRTAEGLQAELVTRKAGVLFCTNGASNSMR